MPSIREKDTLGAERETEQFTPLPESALIPARASVSHFSNVAVCCKLRRLGIDQVQNRPLQSNYGQQDSFAISQGLISPPREECLSFPEGSKQTPTLIAEGARRGKG